MPELAAIYFAGVVVGLFCTIGFIYWNRQRRKGRSWRNLQANLNKVGLFWSDHRDRLLPWTPDVDLKEDGRSTRSLAVAGALLSALSWPGVLFYLLIIASIVFLARSRAERKIFSSPLVNDDDLDPEKVRATLSALELDAPRGS